MMNRRSIVVIATVAAILAAVIPLLSIAGYARHRAIQVETEHLKAYSGWTLQRAEQNFSQARHVFDMLEQDAWAACSPAHIARMRELTIDSQSVDEIGYFVDGQLACTSWGPVQQDIGIGVPSATLVDGYALYLHITPFVTGGAPLLAISRGDYNVLMKHERLVDVLTDTKMTLGLATLDGQLIAMSRKADGALSQALARGLADGHDQDLMYASAENTHFRAFAITDRSTAFDRMDQELLLLIPLGAGMSVILIGLVVWISRQHLSPQGALQLAIKRKAFVTHYQPIIELATGQCAGAEALVRWRQPDGSFVPPDMFIPLAERTGLIEPLTDLVIQRVVDDLASMLRREPSMHVAINIAACDMQSGRFLPVLSRALRGAGVAPTQVWLEATESGFMDVNAARATIDQARQAGHAIAIDDFGTGYSSLSLLQTLPLDALKIDKSFVDAIGTQAATSIVVPHIISMAHGLRFRIVAEGVETAAQEAYLREAGVQFVQGWLYSKALPLEAFLAFYKARNQRRTAPPPDTEATGLTPPPASPSAG
ncbi:EAL domain-containing protein [Orrella dioscoreae]|uniref:cyclic-guanylate-specific phosphodiesterase n=1 Tax=Orrella dioscoreae TaxID=1851544 RepID=A0A1C3JXD2_9BURK|nr:EAL domain-containing protein [Orrella dioscoreae]SBT23949.1 diguanylate cyclase/phosphodiesterase (GGDEF & EAL domains) with PAS/PAC sensor(s) [Orrella dioscoreae]SOE47277.1 diguanylate cyclase/phosphodiesterase (GGDEF & EAL domains) with PAS/PAC sensor(s) [Orrella dioscoreae]